MTAALQVAALTALADLFAVIGRPTARPSGLTPTRGTDDPIAMQGDARRDPRRQVRRRRPAPPDRDSRARPPGPAAGRCRHPVGRAAKSRDHGPRIRLPSGTPSRDHVAPTPLSELASIPCRHSCLPVPTPGPDHGTESRCRPSGCAFASCRRPPALTAKPVPPSVGTVPQSPHDHGTQVARRRTGTARSRPAIALRPPEPRRATVPPSAGATQSPRSRHQSAPPSAPPDRGLCVAPTPRQAGESHAALWERPGVDRHQIPLPSGTARPRTRVASPRPPPERRETVPPSERGATQIRAAITGRLASLRAAARRKPCRPPDRGDAPRPPLRAPNHSMPETRRRPPVGDVSQARITLPTRLTRQLRIGHPAHVRHQQPRARRCRFSRRRTRRSRRQVPGCSRWRCRSRCRSWRRKLGLRAGRW